MNLHLINAYTALMETKLFDIFIDVARTSSFADTARYLGLDPSAVSRAIKQLEHEMGCRLFQRTTRKLSLTHAGQQFLLRVEPIVAELALARAEMQTEANQVKGRLCISASVAFGQLCILPFVDEFLSAYPNIALDLKFTDSNVDLIAEQVDFAIRLGPGIDSNLVRSRLISTFYRVCATPEYLSSNAPIVAPHDLQSHHIVAFDLAEFKHQWLFKKNQQVIEVPVTPKLTISSALGVLGAIKNNIGPGLLPHWLIDKQIAKGALIDLFPEYRIGATSFDTAAWIIYPNRSFLPLKTQIAIEYFRQKIRSGFEYSFNKTS